MMRFCYSILLRMHPAPFRERFAPEMSLIFEETPGQRLALFADGATSLMRQWLFRSGAWKVGLATGLALLQALIVTLFCHLNTR